MLSNEMSPHYMKPHKVREYSGVYIALCSPFLRLALVEKLEDITASMPSREKHAKKPPLEATAILTIGSAKGS